MNDSSNRKIKCLIWDLDNTLWRGILSEDTSVSLMNRVSEIISILDNRGILQSIASRNDYDQAKKQLIQFGLWDYFLYPEINWQSKSISITNIICNLNIGSDAVAFIDDQVFERQEVLFTHSSILCLDADEMLSLLTRDEFIPRFITNESNQRRLYYRSDIQRKNIEHEYSNNEEFLRLLNLELSIKKADTEDIRRAEELTLRTHQLNSTGYTYSYDELLDIMNSRDYDLYVASLRDNFGSYGTIGLLLIEKKSSQWTLKLLLVSCRVISRNVSPALLAFILECAKKTNAEFYAEFIPTDRNRMMYVALKFNGFVEVEKTDQCILLEHNLKDLPTIPEYISVRTGVIEQLQLASDVLF